MYGRRLIVQLMRGPVAGRVLVGKACMADS